jgi:hypothetical protein
MILLESAIAHHHSLGISVTLAAKPRKNEGRLAIHVADTHKGNPIESGQCTTKSKTAYPSIG